MRRNYLLYLEDILESTDKIQNYAGDLSYEDILQDKMRIDAIVRNLEIIGEASGKIPQEVRDKFPSVEWKKYLISEISLPMNISGLNIRLCGT